MKRINNDLILAGVNDAYRQSHCWVAEKNRPESFTEKDESAWNKSWEYDKRQEEDAPYDWDAWFWANE